LSGDGESPGRWYGAGATSLGLEGEASPGWIDRRLHVVHDWDSAVTQAEAAIAGQAAAVWPGTGLPGDVATLAQGQQFLTAYECASGHSWTDRDIRAAWAAGLWTCAFDARRPASSAPIPPPHLPRLKLRNGHGLAVP
jgi:hypothetical protein